MKHIWWGMIAVVVALVAAWVALTIAGHPTEAHQALKALFAPLLVGGTLLTAGLFSGALEMTSGKSFGSFTGTSNSTTAPRDGVPLLSCPKCGSAGHAICVSFGEVKAANERATASESQRPTSSTLRSPTPSGSTAKVTLRPHAAALIGCSSLGAVLGLLFRSGQKARSSSERSRNDRA